ncbi:MULTISPECIES: anion permease [unclassified Halomonas]|uniref:anion permease n=1 Tax=unclassified Halomonas TaxID=2609666 RepID=UPI0009904588|nr:MULTISPECIES: anion permease [unclassified Halomonas]AVU08645.1 hypothetical protein BV504_02100 [Halomonas sp. 'Soap Lake \
MSATLSIWLVIPLPEGLTPNAWLMLAIFVGTIVAIIGKAMPIGAISVIAISIAGFIMSVVNLLIWVVVGGLWWKLLGHY